MRLNLTEFINLHYPDMLKCYLLIKDLSLKYVHKPFKTKNCGS